MLVLLSQNFSKNDLLPLYLKSHHFCFQANSVISTDLLEVYLIPIRLIDSILGLRFMVKKRDKSLRKVILISKETEY